PFDGEGLASAPLDIVADGVLSAFVLDLATARKLGRESNGRAARGTGLPSPSATNISVLGGRGTLQSLMDDAGSGLVITDLIGMGANIVSGNYSRGAAGFWFENGEIVHPVSEVTVAGTLPDMFARAIFADDAPGLFAVDAPSIAIEGMTIGGR
ncbi:MAG: metallopeptidase TldD-related protein, partial [Pseudomonadota bacterium]